MDIKTKIDSKALRRWKRKLPCCEEFLDNFFYSCKDIYPVENFVNYLKDIPGCFSTVDVFEEHMAIVYRRDDLVKAFEEITGLRMNYDVGTEYCL